MSSLRRTYLVLFVAGVVCGAVASFLWLRSANNVVGLVGRSGGLPISIPQPEESNRIPSGISAKRPSTQSDARPAPTLSNLSDAALRRLNVSCLGPDGKLDGMLKELAGLSESEFGDLQNIVDSAQLAHLNKEADRFVSLTNAQEPTIIIPPDPVASAGIEQDYLKSINSLVGDERGRIVKMALARGMEEATGNFGRDTRSISFTASKPSDKNDPIVYLVRVGTYGDDVKSVVQSRKWNELGGVTPANMSSFKFVQLPERFKVFAEQSTPKR
jgi:hypothetical protein